ncbi:MAG TPA: HDOD domain-containing protein [Spirochaetota bacterium]|nr:HDOD domain-containing protein [Spirochaetota bacterium]HPI90691.1 HDOD domain-containing protein [Spirochaetota bacterium]HPR49300.1 HDOD domain-containing protein [Spirochaetota bacterium]
MNIPQIKVLFVNMHRKNSSIHKLAQATEIFEQTGSFIVSMKYPSDRDFQFFNSFIAKILSRTNRIFLLETLISIIRELILNASKANFKRLFFQKSGFDITDPGQYKTGMEQFKKFIKNPDYIKKEIKESGYLITLSITKKNGMLKISVMNNCAPVIEEIQRIIIRIEKAKEVTDFSTAYDSVFDTSEGAGLGIVLIYLLLKNAGIDPSMISVKPAADSMTVTVMIPENLRRQEITSLIKDKIIQEVDALPTLPRHIVDLKKMCSDPTVSIENLATKISRDPSLTADVLRLANSAGISAGRHIENITDAIVIIGLKNLDLILTTVAAKTILEKRYRRFEQIWNHCNKTASYARIIANKYGLKKIAESAFIAGLLHDIGKIVLLAVDMNKVREIAEIVHNKKMISSTILEEISLGISHESIGSMIAEKWNFPDYIIETIKTHHSPLNTSEPYSALVAVVYMANMLCEIENQNAYYSFLESEILDFFGVDNKADFESFHESVKAAHSRTIT